VFLLHDKMKRSTMMLLFCLSILSTVAFHPAFHPSNRAKTVLQMGFGSFVKKRILGKGDDNEKDEFDDVTPPSQPTSQQDLTPTIIPPQEERTPPPTVTKSPRKPYPGAETAQDRINRVKQGKMTDEEKQRFLATTLKNVASSGAKTAGGGPYRQPIPDGGPSPPRVTRSSATPFPKDSMLREVVTGRRDPKAENEWAMSNKKKKEYFEMVTNPNRFNTFNALPNVNPATPTNPAPTQTPVYSRYDTGYSNSEIPWESSLPTATPIPAKPMSPPPVFDPNDSNHLAARLEAHAMAEEKRQQEARRLMEQQREEDLRRQAQFQREREEEMMKREAEAIRKREEALEIARQQEARQREEERLRLEQMMKAQEDFWAKKLQNERQRKSVPKEQKIEPDVQDEDKFEPEMISEDDAVMESQEFSVS
jgi:hypothetical protein